MLLVAPLVCDFVCLDICPDDYRRPTNNAPTCSPLKITRHLILSRLPAQDVVETRSGILDSAGEGPLPAGLALGVIVLVEESVELVG